MAKKKSLAATSASALAQRAPDKYAAISMIADLAKPYGENVRDLLTVDTVDKGAEVLARVRAAQKILEEIGSEATADLKRQMKVFDNERLALTKQLKAADEAVAGRLIDLYVTLPEDGREAMDRRMLGALGSSATVVPNGYSVEVIAEDAIPDKYFKRVVDLEAVKAALESGEAVPGVRKKPKYYLTTRAAEIVK